MPSSLAALCAFSMGTVLMTSLSRVFAIACVGTALPNLDLFAVNIALPRIAAEFPQTSLEDLSWVLNAYAIAYAALLVFLGRLSEGFRRDRSFIFGIGVFTLASAASALASGVWELVVFRVFAATGAALMTPASIGLLLATFPPDRRGPAVRSWAGIGGFAAALGPLVGGLLVTFDWRWVFAANALCGAVPMLIAWRYLPCIPGHQVERPSLPAAVLITAGIACLIFTIAKGNALGWSSKGIVGSALLSLVLLILFVWHCLRSQNPLVEPALFRIRPFTGACLAMFPYSVTFGAMLFSVAMWGQSAWGWTALQTGLAIIPGPLMVPITSRFITGKVIERYGPARAVVAGVALVVLGFCVWATCLGLEPNAPLAIAGMALNGVGVGLVFPTLMGVGVQSLPPSSFATGSAVVNMLRQAAIAIGVAIFVAIVGSPTSAQERLTDFQTGWWVMAVLTAVTLLPTFIYFTTPRTATASRQDEQSTRAS